MATLKAQSLPTGIIKLTRLLEHLNKHPKLTFTNNVKSLRLTLAYSNDHWGARHFVKDDLPRIRHHNPDIEIDITKWRKEKNEHWRPELEVKFGPSRPFFLCNLRKLTLPYTQTTDTSSLSTWTLNHLLRSLKKSCLSQAVIHGKHTWKSPSRQEPRSSLTNSTTANKPPRRKKEERCLICGSSERRIRTRRRRLNWRGRSGRRERRRRRPVM